MNLLILGLSVLLIYSSALAQTKAPDGLTETRPSQEPTRVHSAYDRFEDRTRYWTSALPVLVDGRVDRSLTVLGFFHFRGKGAGHSIERLGLVFFSNSFEWKYAKTSQLYAIVDNQRIEIGSPTTNERDVEGDRAKENLSFSVPYKTMRRIADGKHVEMRLGLTEFQLSEPSLSDLKALLAKIKTVPVSSERKKNRRKQS